MATFNTTDPKPGYVYDSSNDTWYPLLGLATQTLDGLTDVVINSVTDKQLIVYDTASGHWINADAITSTGLVYKPLYPNSKTATGTLGQISIDGANGTMYVCTGTNTWQKISLNSANFTNTGGFN